MPAHIKDLSNKRFRRLIVKKIAKRIPRGNQRGSEGSILVWECVCDCGKTVQVRGTDLKARRTGSCGCLQKESRTKEYRASFRNKPQSLPDGKRMDS